MKFFCIIKSEDFFFSPQSKIFALGREKNRRAEQHGEMAMGLLGTLINNIILNCLSCCSIKYSIISNFQKHLLYTQTCVCLSVCAYKLRKGSELHAWVGARAEIKTQLKNTEK